MKSCAKGLSLSGFGHCALVLFGIAAIGVFLCTPARGMASDGSLPPPSLDLAKTGDKDVVNLGGTVTYSLVTTASYGSFSDVVLVDLLPVEQRCISAESDHGACLVEGDWGATITCTLGNLAMGEVAHTTITAEVTTITLGTLPRVMRNNAMLFCTETPTVVESFFDVWLQDCHCRLNDSATEYDSVQAAVDASTQPTDIVKVAGTCTGIHNGGGQPQVVYLNKSLTIQGGYTTSNWSSPDPTVNQTIVYANGDGRVVKLWGTCNQTLDGLWFVNGHTVMSMPPPWDGGGIYCGYQTSVTLSRCTFLSNNSVAHGGGLDVNLGKIELTGCYFTKNVAASNGGAVHVFDPDRASLTLNNLHDNIARDGGGAAIYRTSPYPYRPPIRFAGNKVTSNTAVGNGAGSSYGGGIIAYGNIILESNDLIENSGANGAGMYAWADYDAQTTVSGNTMKNNTGWYGGGLVAAASNGGKVIVIGNTIEGNFAKHGGGASMQASGVLFKGNTVVGNTARYVDGIGGTGGGVILVLGDKASLVSNNIAGNSADVAGAGMFLSQCSPLIDNNFVTDNRGLAPSVVGGVALTQNSHPAFWHNTFARNDNYAVYADDLSGVCNPVFYNTIVTSHTVGISMHGTCVATMDGTMWGTGEWANDTNGEGSIDWGVVNVYGDPAFLAPDLGDYHIGASSAALDQGIAPTVANGGFAHDIVNDFDDQTRPMGFGPDIGADEAEGPYLSLSKIADVETVALGGTIVYSLTVTAGGLAQSVDTYLTDTLPIEQQAVSAQTDRGTYTIVPGYGGGVVFDLGTMNPGDVAHTTITVQVTTTIPAPLPVLMRNKAKAQAIGAGTGAGADVVLQDCQCRLNNDPTDYDSVQAAVDASTQTTDVVKVAGACGGVNHRGGLRQHVYLDKTLTIQGGYTPSNWTTPDPEANPTTLSAVGLGRVLITTGSIAPKIRGLRLIDGQASGLGGGDGGEDAGGGVYAKCPAVSITSCTVSNSSADKGGGVYASGGTVWIEWSVVSDSIANMKGGGVYAVACHVVFDGSEFSRNSAPDGGGLWCEMCIGTVLRSRITTNTAGRAGGLGIRCDGSQSFYVSRNHIEGNYAGSESGGVFLQNVKGAFDNNLVDSNTASAPAPVQGGGLVVEGGSLDIYQNAITRNAVFGMGTSRGGGVFLQGLSGAVWANFIAYNQAPTDGGGVYAMGGTPAFDSNVITDNTANGRGAGLYLGGCHSRMWHNTICRNTGAIGEGIYTTASGMPPDLHLYNNIVAAQTIGIHLSGLGNVTGDGMLWGAFGWANGTDFLSDVGPGFSWGPVMIHAVPMFVAPDFGDYHILPGSMARDVGVLAETMSGGTPHNFFNDMDNEPRPMGFGPDIGADELPGPWVTLEKRSDVDAANPGGLVVYSLTVRSTGLHSANHVLLTDQLPPEQRVTAAETDHGSVAFDPGYGGRTTCTISLLAPGETACTTITAQMADAFVIPPPFVVTNNASVTADGCPEQTASADVVLHDCHCRLNNEPTDYTTVQSAVDASTQPNDVVKVAGICSGLNNRGIEGSQVVYVDKPLTIRGGYLPGDWIVADPVNNTTTLHALGRGRVVHMTGQVTATLEGLHIVDGQPQNVPLFALHGDGGGGILSDCSVPTVRNCWIHDNKALWGGGVALISPESPASVSRCSITRNTASSTGGGFYVSGGTLAIDANRLAGNEAINGGGLTLDLCAPAVTNNVIADNIGSGNGPGVHITGNVSHFHHNTVARNRGGDGSGIHVANASNLIAMDNIITSQVVGITVDVSSSAMLDAVLWGIAEWGNGTDFVGPVAVGPTNLHGPPAFADPDAGDYHITVGSMATDLGLPFGVSNDMDGDLRPFGGFDIGADELVTTKSADVEVTLTDSPDPALFGSTAEYVVDVANHGPKGATNVVMVDTPVSGTLEYYSSTHGTVSESAGNLVCDIGSLAAGSSATVVMGFRPDVFGVVPDVASAFGDEPDPAPENNTAMTTTLVVTTADVAVEKVASPDPARLGHPFTYTVTVSNLGPQPATDVLMTDELPAEVDFVSSSTAHGEVSLSSNTITWDIGLMAPGTSVVLALVVDPTSTGTLTNVAIVSTTSVDPESGNDKVVTHTDVVHYELIVWHDDTFTTDVTNPTPGGTTGWTPFSAYQTGQVTDYDSANGALRVTISTGSTPRINGWVTGNSEWMPYSIVGSNYYARGKFYVFRTNQANMSDLNQVPNMRLRLSTRFAVTSLLEIFNHLAGDVTGTNLGRELCPSSDPTSPSIYRVDFDPVDVPALNTPGEGISRGFEAYCLEPQENGDIELTESVIGTYHAKACPNSGPWVLAEKTYACSASDAGDLKVFNSVSDGPFFRKFVLLSPGQVGSEVPLDGVTDPTYSESSSGVTLDTMLVATNRLGLALREFTEVGANSERIRIERDRQYKIRWHVTSATNANRNPQLRLRARALKFMWSQKMEIGGALAAGTLNNTIAQQSLPGIGCQNPDQMTPGEAGGWYTMWLHTPLSHDIRDTQPLIEAQPGPGSGASSARDVKYGFDVIDTLSGMTSSVQEKGQFTLDRIELRAYELVDD